MKLDKCKTCGKSKGDHKAKTLNCPIGERNRFYSYTQFSENVFVPKRTASEQTEGWVNLIRDEMV
jgi:hypothetical protein